jgi:hypothetical protein
VRFRKPAIQIALLITVLYGLWLGDFFEPAPTPAEPQLPKVIAPPPPGTVSRQPKLSGRYPYFAQIESKASLSADALTACFLKSPNANARQVRVKLTWDGGGKFRRLNTLPTVGTDIESCLAKVVAGWELPAHPGLQPFSHTLTLLLGGA